MGSTMFCKAKSAFFFFFYAVILDLFPTKMFNSETTSFQHFSSIIFGHPTSGSGGKIGLNILYMKRGKTHKNTDIATTRSNWPSGMIR